MAIHYVNENYRAYGSKIYCVLRAKILARSALISTPLGVAKTISSLIKHLFFFCDLER